MTPLIENNLHRVRELCQQFHVERLSIFGSASKGNFTEESDLDFLVTFDNVPLLEYADNFFDFISELRNLFNRKVDLVSEASLSNPYFIESVEESRQIIYDKRNQEVFV